MLRQVSFYGIIERAIVFGPITWSVQWNRCGVNDVDNHDINYGEGMELLGLNSVKTMAKARQNDRVLLLDYVQNSVVVFNNSIYTELIAPVYKVH